MIFGADYASVDGNRPPDLAAARRAGVRFVILRASYGASPDPVCARDRDAIRAAGMTFGAYLFPLLGASNPPAETQVKAALAAAALIPGKDLPLALDIEFPRGIAATGRTRTEVAAWIGRAVAAVRAQAGCDPLIYSSARVLDGIDSDALAGAANEAIAGCPLWVARYPFKTRIPAQLGAEVAPPPATKAAGDDGHWIHQFQGDALQLPGFSATIDLNRWNVLRLGARGARVSWVQRRLSAAGHPIGDAEPRPLFVEGTPGVWDDAMDAAVRAFQLDRGLVADAVIGPSTFAALAWA